MYNGNYQFSFADAERAQYREWLTTAARAALTYNGSEQAYEELLQTLVAIEAFVKTKNNGQFSADVERMLTRDASPTNQETQKTINDFIDTANAVYFRKLQNAHDFEEILALIGQGGGVIQRTKSTFVQTDEGQLNKATSATPQSLKIKIEPRLAKMIEHLKAEGIYTDDIVAHVCTPDPHMVRKLPYILLQIPRLNKEIVVCDQVGEVTFVSQKILGPDVWANLSKEQLKELPDVMAVKFYNEQDWWDSIRQVLVGDASALLNKKVNVAMFANAKQPLHLELIKQSIFEHRMATDEWPTQNSGKVLYGPYKHTETWQSLNTSVSRATRGLTVANSSLAALNEEISNEFHLDYVHRLKQETFDIDKIKECILVHYLAENAWPTQYSGEVTHGPYKGQVTWSNLNAALYIGGRGLTVKGSSVATLTEEVSKQFELGYVNRLRQPAFEISKIKESILAYYNATRSWPAVRTGMVG